MSNKYVVLVEIKTGKYKYYLGDPSCFKQESFPGYIYHGSFTSLKLARASAKIHMAFPARQEVTRKHVHTMYFDDVGGAYIS